MKYKYQILILLFLISLVISILIATTPTSQICSVKEGCDSVLNSKYANTFGIKNSYYGILGFSILILLTAFQIKKKSDQKKIFITLGTTIGMIIALYFLYLQNFVIHAYCKYCLVVDISVLLSTAIVIFFRKE